MVTQVSSPPSLERFLLLGGDNFRWPPSFLQQGDLVEGPAASVSYPDQGHDGLPADPTSWWYRHRATVVLDALTAASIGPSTLWDIGGGTGLMSSHFRDAGWATVVVEPVGPAALTAVGRADLVISGTLADLRLPDSSVPIIGLFDVLEHMPDPVSLLSECRRVVSPDGALILTVPAHPRLWSEIDRLGGHFRRYTPNRIVAEAAAAGFKVECSSHFFHALALAAFPGRLWASPRAGRPSDDAVCARERRRLAPPPALDALLRGLCGLEARIPDQWRPPFGLSLWALLRPVPADSRKPRPGLDRGSGGVR